jgi:hypothetical protein
MLGDEEARLPSENGGEKTKKRKKKKALGPNIIAHCTYL